MNVLIIVDMLRDFMEEGGVLYCGSDARKIIPFISERIKECRKQNCKIIYICDAHDKNDKEFKMFKPHCVKGTRGAEIIDELKPHEDDIVIEKTRFSAFYGTSLEKVLKELSPKEVYVAGVCTSICVMDAVGDLRNRDYEVIVYKSGVADFDPKSHEFALKRMQDVYGAVIR